ncbi:Gfo/Idh/MocA family protein [Methylocapsa palsarum]|nr:Gfo/Idh/MocA family oxidoreductase [Methylocapsa palsarum]
MINIGVIGYGYWGTNLVRSFAEAPGAVLHVVVDPDPEKLQLAKRRYPGVKTAARLDDILGDPDLDAVAIATPVSTHFDLALAALRAGKHVWLEKPMTETSAQARQLTEEAKKRGLTLLVDHTFIYTGAIRKMRDIVASGDLGDIYYYDSTRVNLGLFQHDVNVISDLAVHDFSILDYIMGKHPAAVSASGVTHFPGMPENLAYISLFYESGAIAHANVNWLAPVKVRQILLGGSKKMIVYDDMATSEKVKVYDCGVKFAKDPQEIYQLRVGYRTGDMWAPKLATSEALRVAADHFVDCIKSSTTPVTDGLLGLRVVEIIEAATASMLRRGETIQLERQGRNV